MSFKICEKKIRAKRMGRKKKMHAPKNCDRRTRCTNSWSILTLKCNANTFCESWHRNSGQLPTDYLLSARVFLPNASVGNWVIRNVRQILLHVRNTRRTTFCWMRGKIKELLFIKVTVYFVPSLFAKNLNKARYNIYGNLLPVFSTEGSRLEEK